MSEVTALAKLDPMAIAALTDLGGNDDLLGGLHSSSSLPQLSIRGKEFRIKVDGKEQRLPGRKIEVVILATRRAVSKKLYLGTYAPGQEPKEPDCQSIDGLRPDSRVESPQSQSCAACPKNVWGSKITATGKQGKECQDYKYMAVVASDNIAGQAFALQVPAGSLKNLGAYGNLLKRSGAVVQAVVTSVEFADAEYPMLEFKPVRSLSPAEIQQVLVAANSPNVQDAVALPSYNNEPVKEAAAVVTAHASVQPVVADVPKPAASAETDSVSDVLAKWGKKS